MNQKHCIREHDIGGVTMHNIKETLTLIDVCKTRKTLALFLAVFLVIALATSLEVLAAGQVKAYGTLTSIEDDGTVIIDDVGYLVSPMLIVRDYRDQSISLTDIVPPQKVYIEYEYTSKGFMIIFMREIAG